MKPFNLIVLIFLIFLSSCANKDQESMTGLSGKIPKVVDYNIHIKPIISDRCFACHGPDKNAIKVGLTLHTKEGAYAELSENPGHFAIVPGKIDQSEVVRRINSTDKEVRMPPAESNLKLNEYERKLITKWIEQGAVYQPHWSLIPVTKTNIPEVENKEWISNPIDNFILAKLESIGLESEEKASKEKLLRRVSFDITGLPPTMEDLNIFLKDESEDAYEKVIDRLLASPHYGERMASEWLDISRYADSHGYQDDRPRTMWPWRDWVINAYNDNLPYNDFVIWQLAGDMLPDATFEQKLASGFNRNHAITQEGGVIEEEYLTEYAADRVQTFSTAFLGLTVQCSRCHDHKYDPISQKEFYQLYSFFNNNNERGKISYSDLAPTPSIKYENIELENEVMAIKEMLAEIEDEQKKFHPEIEEDKLKTWFENLNWQTLETEGLAAKYKLDFREGSSLKDEVTNTFSGTLNHKLALKIPVPAAVNGKFDQGLQFDGSNTLTIGDVGDFEYHQAFSLGGWINYSVSPDHIAGILSRRNGEQNKSGYGLYLDSENSLRIQVVHSLKMLIDVRSKIKIPSNEWTNIYGTYDGSGKASGISLFINGEKQEVEVLSDNLEEKSILVGTQLTVGNWMIRAIERNNLGGFNGSIDEISLYQREISPLEVKYLFDESPEYDARVVYQTYLKRENKAMSRIQHKLDSLRQKDTSIPNVMIMEELDSIKPAFILNRGVYSAKGEQVGRGTPEAVLAFPDSLPKNRLGLAMWLFNEKNPLTSRVLVNRFWQRIYGRGLVSSPEDFGNQGALPSHPELLDWLAMEFMRSEWDMKKLIKLMVMTSTYQQSSEIDPRKFKLDSENVYLSRGPYKKLTAEMMRDQALASSGLLNKKIGGKWVKPYQPAGIWEELANQIGENKYRPGNGADLYRRSIYTYWKRTIPVPSMLTFDASERAMCTVKRQSTSTPLQSLVLLNDPQYIEASRILAEDLIRSSGDEPSIWIENAFKRLVTRSPSSEESGLLLDIYISELRRFEKDTNSGLEVIEIGDSPYNQHIDISKLAALTIVVNAVLNLDETKHS